MKPTAKPLSFVLTFLAMLVISFTAIAQEKKVDIDINTNPGGGDASGFFNQPWVWIVGGAIFILLLVALLRGRGNN